MHSKYLRFQRRICRKHRIAEIAADAEQDGNCYVVPKMVRMLNKPIIKDGRSVSDPNLIAEAIADYVNFLDRAIKLYFENADNKKQAVSLVDSLYNERIKTLKVIL